MTDRVGTEVAKDKQTHTGARDMERKLERMKELVGILNPAARAYYQQDRELMSNREYDVLYDELQQLEESTGTILSDSPTQKVGYEVMTELPKEVHEQPMLSLDKTKSVEELAAFVGEHESLLSWKMDGLTIVLTYRGGVLDKAVTRGNGIVGEVVTNNARVFRNLPVKIPFAGELVLRGEAIITYADFKRINEELGDVDAKYKNPRNLCSGSVRQLNNEITARRSVRFYAFALVRAEGMDFHNSRREQFVWLEKQGFAVVEYRMVTAESVPDMVQEFSRKIGQNAFPSDGLVALYDDIAYGNALGSTSKFPRNAYAFKWADETAETVLREVEWSASRTGLINPVAIFDPVELEGTTVTRASVHNVSIVRELQLGVGDRILVYKANMIIPQIAENRTMSGTLPIPESCPVCGEATEIRAENDAETLICTNPECPAKKIKAFTLFVSRDAMNIEGMSESTLEKFVGLGFVKEFSDIFQLDRFREEIVKLEGFGEKSYQNLMESLAKARHTTLPRVIYSLGIAGVGLANAKLLCAHFDDDMEKLRGASLEEIGEIEGIGPVIAGAVVSWFSHEERVQRLDRLLAQLDIEKKEKTEEQCFSGMTFVVTGSLTHFENRSALKEWIEERGGKVTGSVSAKTNFLINNDAASSSSKNRKARELGVEILTEEQLLDRGV